MTALSALPSAILFAITGFAVFGLAAALFLRAFPGDLWKRALEDHDTGAAIIVAALLLSLAWITAAAVH